MNDDSNDSDNVIRVGFGKPPAVSFGKMNCWRHSPVVERLSRTVHCRDCGVELDAFEELLRVAEAHDRYVYIQQQIKEQQKKLDELNAEHRKAKARLRSISRKDADAAVAEERAKDMERRSSIRWKGEEIARLGAQIAKLAMAEQGIAQARRGIERVEKEAETER